MANIFIKFIEDALIPVIAGTGGGIAVVYFLGKKLLDQLLKKEVLKYKSELEEKTALLKTNLSIYAEEQNIANERIDSQKSMAIHQVYQMICKTMTPISRIIAGSPFVNVDNQVHVKFYFEQSEFAHQYAQKLMDSLYANAIYFDSDIYDEIAKFSHLVMLANAQLLRVMRRLPPEYFTTGNVLQEIEEEKNRIEKIYESKFQPMHRELLSNFRRILGIEK